MVVGAEDAITPVDLLRQVHERIRGSTLAVIPGAGHVPPMETPGLFNESVKRFLDDLR